VGVCPASPPFVIGVDATDERTVPDPCGVLKDRDDDVCLDGEDKVDDAAGEVVGEGSVTGEDTVPDDVVDPPQLAQTAHVEIVCDREQGEEEEEVEVEEVEVEGKVEDNVVERDGVYGLSWDEELEGDKKMRELCADADCRASRADN